MKRSKGGILSALTGRSFAASIARSRRAITRSQAKALTRKLRPYVFRDKPELKFFDVAIADGVITTAGTTIAVNLISQGTGESQRVGRKIIIKAIMLQGVLRLPGTTDGNKTCDVDRIMVIQDKQANKALATVADVLGSSPDILNYRELTNVGRFKVLKTIWRTVNSPAGAGDGTTNDFGQMFKKWSIYIKTNIPIEFNAAAGAITEITTNNIFVLEISQAASIFSQWRCRIRFTG